MHRGKVDPGVSELPRGNELSRDHVNRPLVKEGLRVKTVQLSLSVMYQLNMNYLGPREFDS